MLKSEQIQNRIDELTTAINAGDSDVQLTLWEMERAEKIKELALALAEEAQQQNLQDRVEEAKQNGYLLDTLTASNGMTMAELSYSPENHELVCIAVQKAFLSQQDAFNNKLVGVTDQLTTTAEELRVLEINYERLGNGNHLLKLEKADADEKRDNAVRLAEELQEQVKQQAAKISTLLEQQATGQAIPVAQLSAEELENNLINEINGKQIKVYNVRPKDENAVTNTMFIANNAITGAEFEDYYLYLCKINEDKPKRYKEISEAEAEQLRADFESKKAEINASIPSIPNPQELKPLDVPEIPVAQEEHPKDEVSDGNTEGNSAMEGNTAIPQSLGENAKPAEETTVTYATKEEHEALAARVATIERHANIQAVA